MLNYAQKYIKWIRLAVCAMIVFIFFKFLFPLVLPLIISAVFVCPLRPFLSRVEKKLHIGRGLLTGCLLFLFLFLLVLSIWGFVIWGMGKLSSLTYQMDSYESEIFAFVHNICMGIEEKVGLDGTKIELAAVEKIERITKNFEDEILPSFMGDSFNYIKNILKAIAFIAMTLVSAVMLAKDYEAILKQFRKYPGFLQIKSMFKRTGRLIVVFIRAQAIIMTVIFILCSCGYFVLGLKNPIGLAAVTALLDLLPFVGTGIMIIPMGLWNLINGAYLDTIICLILYVVCAISRELLEPRLIGDRMGIYPVVIVAAIFAGLKLFGGAGVIIGPLALLIMTELYKVSGEV